MENFVIAMAEILEVEKVNVEDELDSYDAWDSLTVLSIIAFCDDEYNVVLSAGEINDSRTLKGLMELILTKKAA